MQPYLHEYGDNWYNEAPRRLCNRALQDFKELPDGQVIYYTKRLLSKILAAVNSLLLEKVT